ncbi:Circadian locomoter output cycles protein kaput [Stylophora pistillata]|uniref:Circadian locomoter output cycles protein kaput n=1 Tax=Stylophora pistillata TaxID=50429 RepID=A0A2B4SQM0_STYPI|nr:Circadian locomoter output cycles protein kaput [Stylophora pistillata]
MKGGDQDPQVSQEKTSNPVKRTSRNLSEKKRRDRFNILVQEIAGIVSPTDCRKLEKSAVLELAINFLRKHQSKVQSHPRNGGGNAASWQPSFATDAEFNLIVAEALDSCIFAVENTGNILYASDSVLPLLGHLSYDLNGTNLCSYLHEGDSLRFWTKLAFVYSGTDTEAGGDNNHFFVRMKSGRFCARNTFKTLHCKFACVRRQKENEARTCVVILAKIEQPQPNRIVMTSDCIEKEFSYRLTMDWKTKGQSWVWLRSSCYVAYNQWNSKPESIDCTATVVNFNEVCLKQTETIRRDREHFERILARHGGDSVCSLNPWPSSWLNGYEEVKLRDEGNECDHKDNNESGIPSQFLNRFLQLPCDKLSNTLDNQSIDDVEMELDEEPDEHLVWLENVKIPPGLSSVQIAMHMKLREEYQKIAQQIRKQEKQLKTIRKLIEWSRLLLELDRSFGAFEVEESSIDSEDVLSVTSSS